MSSSDVSRLGGGAAAPARRKLSTAGHVGLTIVAPTKVEEGGSGVGGGEAGSKPLGGVQQQQQQVQFEVPTGAGSAKEALSIEAPSPQQKKRPRPTLSGLNRLNAEQPAGGVGSPMVFEDSSIVITNLPTPDTPFLDDPLYGRFYLGHGKFAFWPTIWFIVSPFYPGRLFNWHDTTVMGRVVSLPSINPDKARLIAKQLCCLSTSIVVSQVVLVSLMCAVIRVPSHINNMIGPGAHTLLAFGAKDANLIVHHDEWQRLLLPLLLHAGIIEMVVLCPLLLRLGTLLEFRWGTFHWALAYFITGLHGITTGAAQNPKAVGVGGYVAIAGLLGAWFSEQAGMVILGSHAEVSRPQRLIEVGMCSLYLLAILLFSTLASFHSFSPAASAFFAGTLFSMANLWTLPDNNDGGGRRAPRIQLLIRVMAWISLLSLVTYSLVYLYHFAPIPEDDEVIQGRAAGGGVMVPGGGGGGGRT